MFRQFVTAMCLVCAASLLLHKDSLSAGTWVEDIGARWGELVDPVVDTPAAPDTDTDTDSDAAPAAPVVVIEVPVADAAKDDDALPEVPAIDEFRYCPHGPPSFRGCRW